MTYNLFIISTAFLFAVSQTDVSIETDCISYQIFAIWPRLAHKTHTIKKLEQTSKIDKSVRNWILM